MELSIEVLRLMDPADGDAYSSDDENPANWRRVKKRLISFDITKSVEENFPDASWISVNPLDDDPDKMVVADFKFKNALFISQTAKKFSGDFRDFESAMSMLVLQKFSHVRRVKIVAKITSEGKLVWARSTSFRLFDTAMKRQGAELNSVILAENCDEDWPFDIFHRSTITLLGDESTAQSHVNEHSTVAAYDRAWRKAPSGTSAREDLPDVCRIVLALSEEKLCQVLSEL